jgi:hypothetical protein
MYVARSAESHDALTDDDDVCLDSDDNARGFLQLRLAKLGLGDSTARTRKQQHDFPRPVTWLMQTEPKQVCLCQ